MSYVHIVAVGGGTTEPVACAIRHLGASEVVVVGSPTDRDLVAGLVEPLGVPCQREPTSPGGIYAHIEAVRRTVPSEPGQAREFLVNLTPASRRQALGLRLGTLATGAQAIHVGPDSVERLPRLWLDVDVPLGPVEGEILSALATLGSEGAELTELAEETGLPRDEVAYRIRGGEDTTGLEPAGLVDVLCPEGRPRLELTETGTVLASRFPHPQEPLDRRVTANSPTD